MARQAVALRRLGHALLVAFALAGCGGRSGRADEPIALVVDAPPPPPREEEVELRPGHIWVRGTWEMRGGQWRWRAGRFERERAGQVWIAGYWRLRAGRYHWVAGRWRASRAKR